MNQVRLQKALREFDPTDAELRVVTRQALDLADTERFQADAGYLLTPDVIARNLRDAPDEDLPSRWNWWLGSLEAAYGGYHEFQVRVVGRQPSDGADNDGADDDCADNGADDDGAPGADDGGRDSGPDRGFDA